MGWVGLSLAGWQIFCTHLGDSIIFKRSFYFQPQFNVAKKKYLSVGQHHFASFIIIVNNPHVIPSPDRQFNLNNMCRTTRVKNVLKVHLPYPGQNMSIKIWLRI